MNKWRLLLFSVFGLLQITTSDRNFIDGRYSCYDHSQRFSESGTRIIAYEPYQVYRGVPDLQQRKLLDSSLPAREHDIKSPIRNVRQRGLPFESHSNRRHAYERRLSRDRNDDYKHSERDETRQERLERNRDKLTLHSRFVDVSRYSYKFNNGDRMNRENNNMRQYIDNNYLPVQSFSEDRRINQRSEPESEKSKDSVINTRRNFYSDSVSNNRLQPMTRNTHTIRREDQRLFRRNTQVRNRIVIEGNLRLVRETAQIRKNHVDRKVISKRNSNSVRHSTSENLRNDRVENIKRSFPLDSEQLLNVRRQVLTQLRTMNTIVGHILYSREINQMYQTDNSRTISKIIRNVRTTETEQSDRHRRDINTIRTKRHQEIDDVPGKRNGPQHYIAQYNFIYRQNTVDSYRIRDIQRIRESVNVRSERMNLRERRDNNDDEDRSRNLLLLFRYRNSGSDDSRNNINMILEANSHDRLNTEREELIRPQTGIRLENNAIRVNINRENRFNIKRRDTYMTNNRNERNNIEVVEARQEREMLRREFKVNRYNMRRHERYSSRPYIHSDKLDHDLTDVIHEENMIREDNSRQARPNIRQLVRDVVGINIRNEQRREHDDARRERRIRENNRQYTLNARQSRPSSTLRTVNTLDHRVMSTLNEQLFITELENVQNKRDFREQEGDKFRWQSNNDRKLKITSRNMHAVSFRQRIREISVRSDNALNVLRNNQDNLVRSDQNIQRVYKRPNNRKVDTSEIHRANTLNNDDRAYNMIRQNRRHDFRISSRNMRNLYDEHYINRNDERIHRRELQRVDNLYVRRVVRDALQSRSVEGLLRTVQVRISMRTYRGEPEMTARSEESRRTISQRVTENRESSTRYDGVLNTRTIRGERDSDDSDARRDTRRISAIADYRIVSITNKQGTDIFEMKWQYLLYALQAVYLLSFLTKVTKHEEGKNKLRITTWITTAKSLKMD